MQESVRGLVREGRLEFINGGMSMNDEACVHYRDAITNMEEGFEFLAREFGIRPRVGWHVDPFGHASAQAALYADMGLDAFIFWRIDYQDRDKRFAERRMEFMWQGSPSAGEKSEILTSIMPQGYCTPGGFQFNYDYDSHDEPINDDKRIKGYNVDRRADELVKIFREQFEPGMSTNNILVPLGCDFHFMNAFGYFQNMDRLIKYINAHPEKYNINIMYSTPSIYIDYVKEALHKNRIKLETKYDDFFPYNDNRESTWTGYFTTRPALKGYVRSSSALFSAAQSFLSQYIFRHSEKFNLPAQFAKDAITQMGQTIGVLQHHDAVTGTSKQAVAYDYAERLSEATEGLETHLIKGVNDVVFGGKASDLVTCKRLNESVCEPAKSLKKNKDLTVVLHNSLGQRREHLVRIPVPASLKRLSVYGAQMKPIESQLIVFGKKCKRENNDLVFKMTLMPFSFTTVTIKADGDKDLATVSSVEEVNNNVVVGLDKVETGVGSTRLVTKKSSANDGSFETTIVFNYGTNEEKHVTRDYLFYKSYQGDGQKSGAYIFRPESEKAEVVCKKPKLFTVRGPVVDEMYFLFDTKDVMLQDRVTLFPGIKGVALLAVTIGHIDLGNPGVGKEYIIRYKTPLKNTEGYFYTDSMGMEFVERQRNHRPQYEPTILFESAQNYYPVQSAMLLKDRKSGDIVTVVNDRSQAGGSIIDGSMEFMIHRRTAQDDWRGAGEPISEPGVDGKGLTITTEHLLIVGKGEELSYGVRQGNLLMVNPVQIYFSTSKEAAAVVEEGNNALVSFNGPSASLPDNIHLLSGKPIHCPYKTSDGVEMCGHNVMKIRLQNVFAAGEHSKYSVPTKVNLSVLFGGVRVKVIHELELGGTKLRNAGQAINPEDIMIEPMQIRTFLISLDSFSPAKDSRKKFAPSEGL
eukprot:Nk52_evm3s564 gene=Nk52_evmTU3s564